MIEQLGLIGCGLMGGSFALALKRAKLVKRVIGYSKSPSTTERAKQLGVIDIAAPSALLAASEADVVLVAVPVAASESTFKAIRHAITAQTLVMDVGSTKSDVIEAARRGLQEKLGSFVPAHPIAGKEVSGVEHSDAGLYIDRQVILTPIKATRLAHVERAAQIWSGIGARVVAMSNEAHDAAFAAVSHMPHLLAFAYIQSLAAHPDGERYLELAGPGFRDFSRIAGSDPAVWRDILVANRDQILLHTATFRQALAQLEALVAAGDAAGLEQAIAHASKVRTDWHISGGA